MEFGLTADHIRLQKVARQLAADFATRAAEHDRDGSPPKENYVALRDAGFYGLVVPKEYGGQEAGLLGYTIAAEEIAQGCASTALSFNMHAATLASLMHSALPDEMKKWVAELATKQGKLIAAILSEPSTTSIVPMTYACSTRARRVSGGYRLSGKKAFCSMGESSDYLCLFAHPEEIANPQTALVAVVPTDSPGVRFEHVWDTLGMRATRSDNLILEDCFVPDEAILGEPIPKIGEWLATNEPSFNIPYTAVYLGVGFAALSAIKDNVTQRQPKGYGQPLAYHPDIRRRVAMMSAQLEAARWLLRYVAWLADEAYERQRYTDRPKQYGTTVEGQTAEVLATYFKAKYIVGEAVTAATRSALEMGGGHAIFKTSALERLFRDGATATMQHPPSDFCLSSLSVHELQLDPQQIQPPLAQIWE